MAKNKNAINGKDQLELDEKLQNILDQTKSETEALKKILKALDGRSNLNSTGTPANTNIKSNAKKYNK